MLLCAFLFLLFYFSSDDSVLLGSLIGMALFALPVINNLSPLCAFLLSLPFLLIYLTRFSFLFLFHFKTCLLSGQFSINAWEGGTVFEYPNWLLWWWMEEIYWKFTQIAWWKFILSGYLSNTSIFIYFHLVIPHFIIFFFSVSSSIKFINFYWFKFY